MPIYEYECPAGHRVERWQSWQSSPGAIPCETCGHNAVRVISRSTIRVDAVTPYDDEGLGERIESRSQRRRAMKTKGVEEADSTRLHGTKGTVFSFPNETTTSVPPSGAYVRTR